MSKELRQGVGIPKKLTPDIPGDKKNLGSRASRKGDRTNKECCFREF
jgi:hypothetical protein